MKPNPTHPALKKNVKARLMYAERSSFENVRKPGIHLHKTEGVYFNYPVLAVPATPEAYEAMVEQMAKTAFCRVIADQPRFWKGYNWDNASEGVRDTQRAEARANLKAIGITAPALAPKKNGRGKA